VIDSDSDILVARSTDGDATWMAPAAPDTNAARDLRSDELPEIAGHAASTAQSSIPRMR